MPLGDSEELMEILSNIPVLLQQITVDLTEEDAHHRPAGEPWSTVEIIGHLIDIDRGDLDRMTDLHSADTRAAEWGDEMALVEQARYQDRTLEAVLNEFESLRAERLRQMDALEAADWSRTFQFPDQDPVTFTQITTHLCNHDVNHLAQIVRLLNLEA